MRKFLFLLLLMPVCMSAARPVTISREAAIADVDSLVAAIEEVEVDPYALLDKDVFYKAVADTKKSFTADSVTPAQMYLALSRLTGMFRQGHLGVSISYNIIGDSGVVFPFGSMLKVIPGSHKVILTLDTVVDGVRVKKGEEIVSINGRKTPEIVESYLKHAPMEKDAFGWSYLSGDMDFLMWCENPDVKSFDVVLSDGGKTRKHTFNGVAVNKLISPPKEKFVPYDYKLLNDSVMLFSFNTCYWDSEFAYFLRKMNKEARDKGVKHLIIDVRSNGGGNSRAGDEVCRYLTDQKFNGFGGSKVKISNSVLKSYGKRAADMGLNNYKVDSVYVNMDQDELEMELPYDAKYRFPGKSYLLIGPGTFSSASNFAWEYWKFVPGTVIGEETGGVNICVGDVIGKNLPNSKFRMFIPWKIFYHYGAKDGDPIQGTIPDIQVPAEEALTRTLRLIETGK